MKWFNNFIIKYKKQKKEKLIMIKKISAIVIALVICFSAIVVPTSASELADGKDVAFELKWDKEFYNPGDTATLSVYMKVTDDMQLGTGSFAIGFNSAQISQADNSVDNIKANAVGSDLWNSFWKEPANSTVSWLAATIVSKVNTANTAEENALYDQYMKIVIARNTASGSHENATDLKYGLPGSDINALEEPIITFSYVVSADAPEGTVLNAAITSGTVKSSPAQTAFKYIKAPGASTTANVATTAFDVSAAVATASIGEPAAHECTPAEAVRENEVAATCGTDGSYDSVVYCSGCGEELSREAVVVPATGEHVYAKEIERVEPTCTEEGYVVKACGCSDNVNVREPIPATGHTETKVVTKPTCTEAGYTTYTCSVCKAERTADEVPAKGHSYREKVTEATCTTDGYTTYTCSACNDSYVADEVAAIGHNYESEVTRQPACMRPGVLKYTCTNCGDNYKEDIPATNHKNADGTSALEEIPAVPATCKNVGYTAGAKCTLCNTQTIVPEVVPTIDHTWDEGVVTEPTYTTEGYTTYTCTVCGETKADDFTDVKPGVDVEIEQPSSTEVAEGETVTLSAPVADPNFTVVWTTDNGNFAVTENADGSISITPKESGSTTFTVTVYDEEGNVVSSDSIQMTAVVEDAGDDEEEEPWWKKLINWIISFFKKVIEIIVNLVNSLIG